MVESANQCGTPSAERNHDNMTTLGKTVIKALWDEFLTERVKRAVESSVDSQPLESTTVGTPACMAAKQLSQQEFPASTARPSLGLPRDRTSSGPRQ